MLTYPEVDATMGRWWDTWYVRLDDFTDQGVDLGGVVSVSIGFGDGNPSGGAGTVYVDNLLIDLLGCTSAFQPLSDLNKDCQTTVADVVMFADNWLLKDFTVTAVASDAGQLIGSWQFDESAGSAAAADSSGNGYNAIVDANDLGVVWNPAGLSGGCIEFDAEMIVTVPAAVFSGLTDEVTISMWINGDSGDYPGKVNEFMFAVGAISQEAVSWDRSAWQIGSASDYGGQWNHYAAVKADGVMSVYHNGVLVGRNLLADDSMDAALAGEIEFGNNTAKVRIGDKRYNALFVLVDQWRFCAMSHGGHHDKLVRTPSLDKLAKQGAHWGRCYATHPVCTPNRSAIITGRWPWQTGMNANDLMLPPTERCIAHEFNDAGYNSHYIGKWHMNGGGKAYPAGFLPKDWHRRGFTKFEGFNRGHNYWYHNSYMMAVWK